MIKAKLNELKQVIKMITTIISLRLIKRKADRLHKEYDQQFFVVKIKGRITIMSKYQLKQLRAKKKVPLNFTADKLKEISIYYTPAKYDPKRNKRVK